MNTKKPAGRPKLKQSERKVTVSIRLAPETVQYLRSLKRSNSRIIEKALALYRVQQK